MIRKVAVLFVLLTLGATVVLFSAYSFSNARVRKELPFSGMTLSYQGYVNWVSPRLFYRMVTFYGDPSEPGYMWVRDSEGQPDDPGDDRVLKIDVETLKIVGEEGYSEALFPTDLRVGDEVTGYWGGTVTIVGVQRMAVMGKGVDAWIVYAGLEEIGWGHYTMYYDKKTGIWLGGNCVWYDGDTLNSWTMHLVSTNVPLFDE